LNIHPMMMIMIMIMIMMMREMKSPCVDHNSWEDGRDTKMESFRQHAVGKNKHSSLC
jgi:hypothetical protein